MRGDTHILGGVTIACLTTALTNLYIPTITKDASTITDITLFSIFIGGSVVGSLLPDIDHKNSKMSHKHPVASFFTRLFTTHRGFTHSLTFLGIIAITLFILIKGYYLINPNHVIYLYPAYFGLIIGFGSHLVLDMLNPKGVALFYPCKIKFTIARIKTGGFFEWSFKIILCLSLFLIIYLKAKTIS